jgi:hypothetical protein
VKGNEDFTEGSRIYRAKWEFKLVFPTLVPFHSRLVVSSKVKYQAWSDLGWKYFRRTKHATVGWEIDGYAWKGGMYQGVWCRTCFTPNALPASDSDNDGTCRFDKYLPYQGLSSIHTAPFVHHYYYHDDGWKRCIDYNVQVSPTCGTSGDACGTVDYKFYTL